MKKLSFLLAGLLISGGAYASNVKMTNYETVKQKAMGGATILSEVNENALVNNPALLNEIDKWELNIFGMSVSVSTDTMDTADGIMSMMDDIDSLGDGDDEKIISLLEAYLEGIPWTDDDTEITYNTDLAKLSNKKLVLDLTQVIAYAKKNFGVGIFTAINVNDMRLINNPVSPEIKVDIGGTVQVPIGFSYDFGKKNQYVIGTAVKAVIGGNATAELDATDLAEDGDIPITVQSYTGMALDLGGIYRTGYLNYALTINNAFSKLDVTEKVGDGDEVDITGKKLPLTVNFAISNKYDKKDRLDKWWDKNVFWTLELKNLTNTDLDADGEKDDNLYKKIHFGASSMVFNNKWIKLDLRAGLNQGYPTYGFGTEMFSLVNLDYAYSTRELGPHIGMKEETLHSITIDFRM
jgi:hypothetical protein